MVKEISLDGGNLKKDSIDNPKIICGYQGFGLVGALAINHLIEEMDFKEIGGSQLRKVPPIIALREGRMYKPISILYNNNKNLIVVFILAPTKEIEWDIADIIENIAQNVNAKEIILTDGIAVRSNHDVYYLSNYCSENECKNMQGKAEPVKNSLVGGVTSALLMKDLNVLAFLGNTLKEDPKKQVTPADAAVNIIKSLNWYLKLKIGTQKLEKLGESMEKEFEKFISRLKDMKQPKPGLKNYIG